MPKLILTLFQPMILIFDLQAPETKRCMVGSSLTVLTGLP